MLDKQNNQINELSSMVKTLLEEQKQLKESIMNK